MGSPLSPARCLTVVSISEQIWSITFNQLLSNHNLFIRHIRYVDNCLIFGDKRLTELAPYEVLLDDGFYGKPIILETEPDQEFLGFMLETKPLELIYQGPTNVSQVLSPFSASPPKVLLSGFRSRCHIVTKGAFPEFRVQQGLDQLIHLYTHAGFPKEELRDISNYILIKHQNFRTFSRQVKQALPVCHVALLLLLFFAFSSSFFPRASERRVLPIVGVCKTSSHLHIFFSTSSHLHIFSSSHLLIFTSSQHLLIFTSSHLHICSSSHLLSHLLIFTSAHLHIFSHIFSSSHLLIFTSSQHLLIFTSSHLHICSSSHLLSHLLIFTSAHLHIFSHIFSSSHLLIFRSSLTSSHLHICSSSHLLSHLLIFTSAHLHIFSHICSSSHLLMSISSLAFFIFLSLGGSRGSGNETPRNATLSHEMRFDRQKLRKNCDFKSSRATLSHEMRFDREKLRKNCDFKVSAATLSHEMRFDRQKLRKNCDFKVSAATLSHEMRFDRQKLR